MNIDLKLVSSEKFKFYKLYLRSAELIRKSKKRDSFLSDFRQALGEFTFNKSGS
jgi:hypothetical protein